MKILIELPTWLGDALMTTPAIENLVRHFDDVEITFLGSMTPIESLKTHPKVVKTYVIDKNFLNLYKTLMGLEEFDLFFSFRSSLRAKLIKLLTSSKGKFQFDRNKYKNLHQVEKYNNFINDSLNTNYTPGHLAIYNKNYKKNHNHKLLGINPGGSYGSSKRWYPREFASVATQLSNRYDVIIFGGDEEKAIAEDIEKQLIDNGVKNYQNLAGKTSIKTLIDKIATLDLFITGDSGPMHLASALQVPTIAIFGPTNHQETSQWKNEKSFIVKKSLECQPCMRRTCPLKHHDCMKLIVSKDVLRIAENIN